MSPIGNGIPIRKAGSASTSTATSSFAASGAIFPEDELPADQSEFITINHEMADCWPNIAKKKDPPADSDKWRGVLGKRQYLER